MDIDVPDNMTDVHMELVQDVQRLKSVKVEASRGEYLRQLALFKKYFIGSTRNASSCRIVNEDKIELQSTTDKQELFASCPDPIEIENAALGYRIFYSLETFDLNLGAQTLTIAGYPRLEELGKVSTDDVQLSKNRDRAYYGSITHFMRSLYQGELTKNNFNLLIWRKPNPPKVKTDRHYSTKPAFFPLELRDFRALPADSLVTLEIAFFDATPEPEYFKDKGYKRGMRVIAWPQVTTFKYLHHGLVIHENGYYDDPLDFYMLGYMPWKDQVMAELLPHEYRPKLGPEIAERMNKTDRTDSLALMKGDQ